MGKSGNVAHQLSEKKRIIAYARLSAKEKLEWLHAASDFCRKAVRGKARKSWLSFGRSPRIAG